MYNTKYTKTRNYTQTAQCTTQIVTLRNTIINSTYRHHLMRAYPEGVSILSFGRKCAEYWCTFLSPHAFCTTLRSYYSVH